MDTLVDYLPLIVFGFFILRAIFRRPKQRQQPSDRQQVTRTTMPRQEAPAAPQATPFEDLVRRIEAAAAEAARQSGGGRPTPPPQPPRAARPAPPPIPAARRPPPSVDTEFHQVERLVPDAEFHQVERVSTEPEFHPSYDLTPEQRAYHEGHRAAGGPAPSARMPSSAMPSRDMPGAHLHDPRRAEAGRGRHPIVAGLMTPQGVRAAFVLKEVMGERRGARPPGRR